MTEPLRRFRIAATPDGKVTLAPSLNGEYVLHADYVAEMADLMESTSVFVTAVTAALKCVAPPDTSSRPGQAFGGTPGGNFGGGGTEPTGGGATGGKGSPQVK